MRVLFINSFYYPIVRGGAERTLRTLVEGLIARGHEVSVVSLVSSQADGGGEAGRPFYSRGVGIKNVYFPSLDGAPSKLRKAAWHFLDIYNPFYRKELIRRIVDFDPDLVSCHNLSGFSPSVWRIIKSQGVPIVQVLHDYYLSCFRSMRSKQGGACYTQCGECRALKWPAKQASANVDSVVGISEYILSVFDELGYFPKASIKSAIHNAERPPSRVGFRPKGGRRFTFGFIGAIVPHKGLHVLLEAMQGGLSDSQLLIAGDGDPRYMDRLQSKYSLACVSFLGRTSATDFFPELDCLVVPSLSDEPLGRVAFEALSYGVPVLASRRGGLQEIVSDGVNGWLFEPGNASALRRLMLSLADGEVSLSRDCIIESGSHFYDVDRFVRAYEDLYRDTLGRYRASVHAEEAN